LAIPEQQQRRMIFWTLSLVGLLSGVGAFSMLRPPPAEELAAHFQPAPVSARHSLSSAAARKKASGRMPASVSEDDRTLTFADQPPLARAAQALKPDILAGHVVTDITLPCPSAKAETSGHLAAGHLAKEIKQVRLAGDTCNGSDAIVSSEISNLANGFSATVFLPTTHSFMTDYISLAKGRNQIRILQTFKTGKKIERNYLIERI
jgi:hypothetical protein